MSEPITNRQKYEYFKRMFIDVERDMPYSEVSVASEFVTRYCDRQLYENYTIECRQAHRDNHAETQRAWEKCVDDIINNISIDEYDNVTSNDVASNDAASTDAIPNDAAANTTPSDAPNDAAPLQDDNIDYDPPSVNL